MRMGIDFDNTIACYDGAFHAAAVARGLIPVEVEADKTSVRDYLRRQGRDADFTALQGYVYGPGMQHVSVFPGLSQSLRRFLNAGWELFVISHKTKVPFAGPPYDLHAAARAFLADQGLVGSADAPFTADRIRFEPTLADKIARIAALDCAVFIDDLPEVLGAPDFPADTRRILFDPQGHHQGGGSAGFERHGDWRSLTEAILAVEGA